MKQITVTITSSESVILRIERFLALLHLSSAWGHTCTAAMDIDGDGSEKVVVSGIDISAHARYIEAITRRPRTKSVDWVASEQEAVEHRVHTDAACACGSQAFYTDKVLGVVCCRCQAPRQ